MNEHNLKKLNEIVLELVQPRKVIFPQSTLNILAKYFPNETLIFMTGPTFELFTDNTIGLKTNHTHYVYQPTFVKHVRNIERVGEYWRHFANDDPLQPSNLPYHMRDKYAIKWSDFENKVRRKNTFWNLVGNPYGITMYLQYRKICLGCIAVYHDMELGDFTDEDFELFTSISKFLAPLYRSYIQESFYAGIADILQKYYEPDNVAFTIVTADAKPIYINKKMEEYCQDILQYMQDSVYVKEIVSSGNSEVAKVVRMLTQSFSPITESVNRTIVTNTKRYKCELRSCMMTGLSADIHMLFTLRVHAKSINAMAGLESFGIKYDLTKREVEIVRCLINNEKNDQIAERLSISVSTVKTHIRNIYRKTGVSHRLDLFNLIGGEYADESK